MSGVLQSSFAKWLLVFAACVAASVYFHSGKKINGVIWSDQEGYYIYLPAVFIHGGFENVPCVNGCGQIEGPHGPVLFTKYTYGVALLESPFFLVAHTIAPLFGHERDGRSLPYAWGVAIAAIFYMLCGLALLSKVLAELNFQKNIRVISLTGLLVGTNLFYYTFRESGMSHVYAFFLFSVLIFSSHRRNTSRGYFWDVLSATSLAVIVLIRPTNLVAGLIPVLWGAQTSEILARVKHFLLDFRWWVTFLVILIIVFTPQLLYWNHVSGSYIFYSYGDEGFKYAFRPKMLQVLFSPQNGWLIYSPLAAIGLYGIWVMAKRKSGGWLLPAVLIAIATYIFGSWWAWWFGGAYGHRCYVDFLPLLAVPAAYAVQQITYSNLWLKRMVSAAAFVAIYVNIRMSDFYQGMWDGPDWGWRNYLEKLANAFYLFL